MGYLSLSCKARSAVVTCASHGPVSASSNAATTTSASADLKKKKKKKKKKPGVDSPSFPFKQFDYADVESATNNFSDDSLLGRGSHGCVYKAVLSGRTVAVKRPTKRRHADAGPGDRAEVENEFEILSEIRNPRFVNLLGFATDEDRRRLLLVVEYMPNGTLFDLIHSRPDPPSWSRRFRLALQTAKAILALHSMDPPVIHRDVKSANVLVDRGFNARLGDFGLALRAGRSAPPAGTLGYLDPAYVTPEDLGTETDVFSFGILLLEIFTGRKAIDVAHSPPSVIEWAVPIVRRGRSAAVYDPRVPPPRDPAARRRLAALAVRCVSARGDRRPSMAEVVDRLEELSRARGGVGGGSRRWGTGLANPCLMVDGAVAASGGGGSARNPRSARRVFSESGPPSGGGGGGGGRNLMDFLKDGSDGGGESGLRHRLRQRSTRVPDVPRDYVIRLRRNKSERLAGVRVAAKEQI
ncbi:Serine/threonine-protein kinase-like protein [Acorus gramineus]|uniref:Serine/threonine-protein kinase-like protein n=1 Tax=Acorus gramineus TaxID=55184 RepID=A0AAV9BQD8_ACOGR|nr:Serine/threonine-protein kinase-like protein [Acorus gramineus]